MKAKNSQEAQFLEQIPNIGKSIAQDLQLLGIINPKQLMDKDGIKLYHKLNKITGVTHDPCVADVFMSAVNFMNGGLPKPWWMFTNKRKELLK